MKKILLLCLLVLGCLGESQGPANPGTGYATYCIDKFEYFVFIDDSTSIHYSGNMVIQNTFKLFVAARDIDRGDVEAEGDYVISYGVSPNISEIRIFPESVSPDGIYIGDYRERNDSLLFLFAVGYGYGSALEAFIWRRENNALVTRDSTDYYYLDMRFDTKCEN